MKSSMHEVFLTGCDKHTELDAVEKVCWIDTDCEVVANIEDIFTRTVFGKLAMVEDRPWTLRRPDMGRWYNSGVVAVNGTPNILKAWADECIRNPVQGDQEVLYLMMNGDEIYKMTCIEPMPHHYNTLRLDYIDGINVGKPRIIHHTGKVGNETIRKQMNELST
jgi:hypothetical protein